MFLSLRLTLFLFAVTLSVNSQLLSLVENHRINIKDPSDKILLAKFSSDSSKILLVNQKSTQIWSAKTGKLLVTFQEPITSYMGSGFDVSWQPGGSKILQYFREDYTKKRPAILWDGETGQKIATLDEKSGVEWAEWNSSGDRILTVGSCYNPPSNFTFSVRDNNGRIIRSETRGNGYSVIRFSRTDRIITSHDARKNRKSIEIVDVDTGKLEQGLDHDLAKVSSLTYARFAGESPNGRYLCGQIEESKGVACWRKDNEKPIYYFLDTKQTGNNVFLSFSDDSKLIATLKSRQKVIDIADAATGRVQFTITGLKSTLWLRTYWRYAGFEYGDLWSPNGKEFIATDVEKEVSIWNVETKQLVSRRPAIWDSEHDWFVGTLPTDVEVFSFNSRNGLLLSVSNQVVSIWDPSSGTLLKQIAYPSDKKGKNVSPRVSTWSPDGEMLLTAANNNHSVIVWTVTN